MLISTGLDLLRGGLFVLAHSFGGSLGAAIVVASVALRIALLPISLPAARRRVARERQMRALGPELAAIQRRFREQPERLVAETQRLYAAHGIAMLDPRMLVDGVLQFPPAAALYSAIRGIGTKTGGFLWMADLISADRALALAASVIAGVMGWIAVASPDARPVSQLAPVLITAAVTFAILSHVSAGVALYSITNSLIGGVEQAIARRMRPLAIPLGRATT